MTGNPSELAAGGVLGDAEQKGLSLAKGCGAALSLARVGREAGIIHAERCENGFRRVGVEADSGNLPDQFPQEDEIDVGIFEAAPHCAMAFLCGGTGQDGLFRLNCLQGEIVESRGVGQEVHYQDVVLAFAGEFRKPFFERIYQRKPVRIG
jgi:hypothetical protein